MIEEHEVIETGTVLAKAGCLYVVATPIGHSKDISLRAIEILRTCKLIACEDTRVTSRFLKLLGINTPTVSYHEQNEQQQSINLAEKLEQGLSIALVCDAGTPTISDPGFRVVRECRRRGILVIPIPGASAITATLSVSGLPTNGFLYVGFLPPKTSARKNFFQKYKDFEYTLVCYESCHRIEKFLDDLIEVLGDQRVICVAREITKLYETFSIGNASEVRTAVRKAAIKGEFVVAIAPHNFVL